MTTAQTSTAIIRRATAADTAALVALGLAFIRESSYAEHFEPDPAQLEKVVAYLLTHAECVMLVAEQDGAVIGMIGLAVIPHLYTGVPTAGELVYYVDPLHRGIGVRLLHAAETWAKDAGAHAISMIAPTDVVGRFYTRLGYSFTESNYWKRI